MADASKKSRPVAKPSTAKSSKLIAGKSAGTGAKTPLAPPPRSAAGAKAAKPLARPVVKAASKLAARPTPKAAAKPAPASLPKSVAKAAPKLASKPVAKPLAKPAPKPQPVVAAKSAPKPAPKTAAPAKSAAVSVREIKPPAGASLLLQGANWVTLNMVREVLQGDVRIEHGRITAIGERLKPRKDEQVVSVHGLTAFPGFVQLHVHLCQTLFRHMAEDLALFDWLRNRIWPLEAAHNPASLAASSRLGILELLLSGTTTVFTMETTHHTETVFQELIAGGQRAYSGKAMMDSGRGVPPELREDTTASLDLARRHLADWHGKGRLSVTLNPRFAPSCSADLLKGVAGLARESGAWIHTHVAETRDEVQLTREVFGRNPVQLYEALGYLEGKFLGVHAVHLTEAEKLIIAAHRNAVLAHCPSANLKLGSGIAPLSDLLARGIRVGLGADGAACNNNLNILEELRLAGLLQKVSRGAATLSAETLLELATIDAARAIGLEEEIGSIEPGKKADLVFFDLNHPSIQPAGTPAQQLVWSASSRDLVHTLVEGEFLVKDRRATRLDHEEVLKNAKFEARKLVARAGLEGKVRL
ncbi:MAG: amidohydrolase family protein [Candidatus Delongbacteria bacterium]